MNYPKHYQLLIQKCQSRNLDSTIYAEKHHIIPKCLNGSDNKSNLVKLLPREHFFAHRLLAKIYPNPHGLVYALARMKQHCTNYYTYEQIRIQCSKIRKGKTKDNCPNVLSMSKKLMGRTKESHEYLKLNGIKISNKFKGQTKESSSRVQKMSDHKKGKNKTNCFHILEMSKKLTGRTKESHNYLQVISDKLNKLALEQRIEIVVAKNQGISFTRLHKYLVDQQIDICYSTIASMYKREKDTILLNLSKEEINQINFKIFEIFNK